MNLPTIIGNATLYLGDAYEIRPTLGWFDADVTDPPYEFESSGGGKWRNARDDYHGEPVNGRRGHGRRNHSEAYGFRLTAGLVIDHGGQLVRLPRNGHSGTWQGDRSGRLGERQAPARNDQASGRARLCMGSAGQAAKKASEPFQNSQCDGPTYGEGADEYRRAYQGWPSMSPAHAVLFARVAALDNPLRRPQPHQGRWR